VGRNALLSNGLILEKKLEVELQADRAETTSKAGTVRNEKNIMAQGPPV
jgi:hypothetical protein